jgi:hypothetical protein
MSRLHERVIRKMQQMAPQAGVYTPMLAMAPMMLERMTEAELRCMLLDIQAWCKSCLEDP